MSWPNKVYGHSCITETVDTNDSTLVRYIKGPVRGGKLLDVKGIANLTVVQGANNKQTTNGNATHFTGSCEVSNATGYYPAVMDQAFTVNAVVNNSTFGANEIIAKSAEALNGGVNAWILAKLSSENMLAQSLQGGVGYYFSGVVPNNKLILVSFNVNPATNQIGVSIDGNNYALGKTAGLWGGFGSAGLWLGGRTTAETLRFKGSMGPLTVYSELKNNTWIRAQWVKIAQAAQFKTGWGSKVSIANESTAGNFVGGGSSPFEILSGTWKVSVQSVDGELHKVIECVAPGTVWLDRHFLNINSTEAAYGSWRGLVYHAPSATPTTVAITASAKDTPSVTSGYYVRVYNAEGRFGRYAAGAFTDLRTVTAPGAATSVTEFHMTRRFDSYWQTSARLGPGAYGNFWTDWQTSVADLSATYLTSEGMSFTANAGDWLSLGTVRNNYALTKFLGEFLPTEV